MLPRARRIAKKIFSHAGNCPLQVFIRSKKGMLARFANNGVHQNGFQDLFSYTLRVLTKEGAVYAESNDDSDDGLRSAWDRLREKISDSKPFKISNKKPPAKIRENFPLEVAGIPSRAARAIGEALERIRAERVSANGYYSAYERFFYLADSRGLELFHPATSARFGVTITKGEAKGYAACFHPDPRKVKVAPVVDQAVRWARLGAQEAISLAPGEYECVFSPRAMIELVSPLLHHLDQKKYETRKSVLSGLLGKKIFSKAFTFFEDVRHPGQFGIPFDAEGDSKRKVVLVKEGILSALLAEGNSTRGWLEHPFIPQSLVIESQKDSLEQIFAKIRHGIFINKIWYHTLVSEKNMEVTGLAAAGCLYLENGNVRGRVAHLRYHDSIFSILRSVVATSREQILLKDGEMGAALFPYVWGSRIKIV